MTDQTIEQARKVITGLEVFKGADAATIPVTRLGGLTNLVFRVEHEGQVLCLRLPGSGTEEYIDRKVEAHNARAAARAGVSPQVLFTDPETGIMVAKFLDGFETMTPQIFASKKGAAGRAGTAFAKLHNSNEKFEFRFELFSMIDEYLEILAKKTVEFPDGYHDVLTESGAVRRALAANPSKLAPCHCDPLCENFLDDGKTMWIIDWEYSGMNDPLWDLGDLSVEGGFSEDLDMEMLNAYFPGGPGASDVARMVIYKAMCDLLWTLWGLIQHANDNPAEDFRAYAAGRFE
ncbi:MAG TPA: LPS biosynthesis choline kinase, partial [Rhizobiales bacterium]|nr:LPS biosynthesis choline kinase [Hyphomicrobiales bacterium]